MQTSTVRSTSLSIRTREGLRTFLVWDSGTASNVQNGSKVKIAWCNIGEGRTTNEGRPVNQSLGDKRDADICLEFVY